MKAVSIFVASLATCWTFFSFSGHGQSLQSSNLASVKKLVPISGDIDVIKEDEKVEEVKPTFNLAGSIDTYFHSTFKTTNSYYGDAYASSTSFADQKGFALGMVNLIATYSGEKAGFTADLVFGPR